jgi:hypothetical protein
MAAPLRRNSTAPTRKCAKCGERFALKRRRGRNLSGRKRLRPARYHEGARYCSDTCRKLASKARLSGRQPSPVDAKNRSKPRGCPHVLSTVTHAENSDAISVPCKPQKPKPRLTEMPVSKELWRRIVGTEIFDRQWRSITSSDGVMCDVALLRRPPG